MSVEIRLPDISEGVDGGDVVKVMVAVGDTVEVDQSLVELETDKAVFEVPSTAAGTVSAIHVKEGESVKVGDVIVTVDGDGAVAGERKPAKRESTQEATAAPVPNDTAEEAAPPTPAAKQPAPAPAATPAVSKSASIALDPAPASPTVRRLARELGIDIHDVPGTGPAGRISSDDVHKYAKAIIANAGSTAGAAPAPQGAQPLPDFSRFGDVERVPMSKVREVTARTMATAWNTVPHVTQHDHADITELEAARKRYGKRAEAAGGKLTMTAILLKVCAGALHAFPDFNASIDVARGEIVRKKYVNIGVAVDTERGLLVPVVRDVDRKNIVQLSVELTEVAEKARTKKVTPDLLEGGNFTISNLGGIGGTSFTPIVYHPEVAILGVSRASLRPVWTGGRFEPRLMLPLSLSYDHRIIDGAAAARFARWVCEALEDPILLALEG